MKVWLHKKISRLSSPFQIGAKCWTIGVVWTICLFLAEYVYKNTVTLCTLTYNVSHYLHSFQSTIGKYYSQKCLLSKEAFYAGFKQEQGKRIALNEFLKYHALLWRCTVQTQRSYIKKRHSQNSRTDNWESPWRIIRSGCNTICIHQYNHNCLIAHPALTFTQHYCFRLHRINSNFRTFHLGISSSNIKQ